MMKLVIFGVAAFLIGIGGSTGVMVMTAPAKAPGADSLAVHADSLAHHGEAHADSTHLAAKPDSAAAHAPVEGPVPDATVASHTSPIETVKPESDGVHEGRSAAAPDAETYKSVGSILMNMKPAEAAKIVGYMTDDQVEGLLRSMSPRNAATVLAQLPSERAATLSKRLLVPAPKEAH